MAIAGGMTTAYNVRLWGKELKMSQTTFPSDLCVAPAAAVTEVARGQRVTVKGSDVVQFQRLWREANAIQP